MSENQRLSNNGSVEEFYTAPDEYEKTTTASKQLPPSFNAPDLPPTTPVTSEKTAVEKDRRESMDKKHMDKKHGETAVGEDLNDQEIYKIDKRYDLLSSEGLSRAMRIFKQHFEFPDFRFLDAKSIEKINVAANASVFHPYLSGAIVRQISLDLESLRFLNGLVADNQETGKKRMQYFITAQDLDKMSGPFEYRAEASNVIKFRPLNQTKEHTADELMTLYSSDSHMTDFLQLIQNLPVYPVIADKNGLISLVPVVDAEPMKISIETKSLMIIVTSVDKENGIRILNNVLAAISIRIEKPLVVEPVLIEYEKFEEPRALELSPPLSYRKMTVTTPEINTKIGLNLQDEEMANLLNNMSLKAEVASKEVLEVMIPPTRHDILHACDISEDVGVACAYKNFLRDLSKEPPNITNFNRISSTLSKLLELDETNPDSVFSRKHSSELKKVTAKVLTLMKGEVKRAEKNLLMIQSKVGLEMSDSETEKAADEQSVEKKRNSSSQNPMES